MDIYAEITNRIINQLEQGVIPWRNSFLREHNSRSFL